MSSAENELVITVLEPWEKEVLEGLTQPLLPEEGGRDLVLPRPRVYSRGAHSYDKHP